MPPNYKLRCGMCGGEWSRTDAPPEACPYCNSPATEPVEQPDASQATDTATQTGIGEWAG